MDSELGVVKREHRPELVTVLSRLLYAKLVQRKVQVLHALDPPNSETRNRNPKPDPDPSTQSSIRTL